MKTERSSSKLGELLDKRKTKYFDATPQERLKAALELSTLVRKLREAYVQSRTTQ